MQAFEVIIVGGGAAGFFTAINLAKLRPHATIAILERGKEMLTKVKISGGGRCNVTHAEFLPKELTAYYPRGEKELQGPFHTFMTGDTMGWFEERGVALKIEEDGRVFPVSNSSQTIIDCFFSEAKKLGVPLFKNHALQKLRRLQETWQLTTTQGAFETKHLVIATGSNPKIWKLMGQLGHQLVPAVPSLFTFNIKDARIAALPGVVTAARVKVVGTTLETEGPLLITHWGMSGPAILKLSAWGARQLHALNYDFEITVNWLVAVHQEEALSLLKALKNTNTRQQLGKYAQLELPKRLWHRLLIAAGIALETRWAEVNNRQLNNLARALTQGKFKVNGKSTFKEEFVTAGGIALPEVNFKTFGSKKYENLYFAGEVLDIDAITGGFNFQNAWTGGYIVAQAIAAKLHHV